MEPVTAPALSLYHPPDDELTLEEQFSLHWQMTNCERFALQDLLRRIKPETSLEIGTYRGGSLQVISHFSQRVISLDIDPTVPDRMGSRFSNVTFRVGPSQELLPSVLAECTANGSSIEFVLVDGDHSTAGVRRDIEALLRYIPKKRCVVIMHDSFNPACREGIRTAPWAACPYVKWVDLDFIPGIYHQHAYDTAEARTMWGGFACAVLEPVPRVGDLVVRESQRGLFEAVRAVSVHAAKRQPQRTPGLVERVARKLSI